MMRKKSHGAAALLLITAAVCAATVSCTKANGAPRPAGNGTGTAETAAAEAGEAEAVPEPAPGAPLSTQDALPAQELLEPQEGNWHSGRVTVAATEEPDLLPDERGAVVAYSADGGTELVLLPGKHGEDAVIAVVDTERQQTDAFVRITGGLSYDNTLHIADDGSYFLFMADSGEGDMAASAVVPLHGTDHAGLDVGVMTVRYALLSDVPGINSWRNRGFAAQEGCEVPVIERTAERVGSGGKSQYWFKVMLYGGLWVPSESIMLQEGVFERLPASSVPCFSAMPEGSWYAAPGTGHWELYTRPDEESRPYSRGAEGHLVYVDAIAEGWCHVLYPYVAFSRTDGLRRKEALGSAYTPGMGGTGFTEHVTARSSGGKSPAVHAEPSSGSRVLYEAVDGEHLTLQGNTDDGWSAVSADSKAIGFLHDDFIGWK